MENVLRIFAPATVANVACGFDIFGFALESPGDEIQVKLSTSSGVKIKEITGDGGVLPYDPAKNTAGVSVSKLLKHLKTKQGVEISIHKKMPMGSGLGSSAASAAGSVFGVNLLLGGPLLISELVPFAMEAERVACGSAHADNVGPALLGGFVLIRSYTPLDIVKVPCVLTLYCTILHPSMEIHTGEARKILKRQVSLKKHIAQTGNAAGLVLGLTQGDAGLISRCLNDVIIEPLRAILIPGFYEIKKAALEAGALGCSISGSGPSVFALTTDATQAANIGKEMGRACEALNMTYDVFISKMNLEGPKVLP